MHYLLLASVTWYALYFYALYKKLSVLKARNAKLIFPTGTDNAADSCELDKGEYVADNGERSGFIKRPVIHLYMLGWGLPLALCSIIVSITRQDYVQTPFSFCFTNEPNILVGRYETLTF